MQTSNKEIRICMDRDENGHGLVVVEGESFGTLEDLKRTLDAECEREILRKLRAAGVSLTLLNGKPQINVPAAAQHLVKVEGKSEVLTYRIHTEDGKETGFRLEIVDGKSRFAIDADQFVVDGAPLYDPRKGK